MGWARDCEGTKLGQLSRIGLGDSPHHTMQVLSHANWKQRKKGRGGLPSRVPAARRLAGHWFACGRWWVIPLMSPPCFFPSVKLPLSWPINFPVLLLYISLLATEGGEGGTAASSSVAAWLLPGINLGTYGTQAHTSAWNLHSSNMVFVTGLHESMVLGLNHGRLSYI